MVSLVRLKQEHVLARTIGLIITLAVAADAASPCAVHPGLSESYYAKSCPKATITAYNMIKKLTSKEDDLPADLVRLHFHDCFVRGCDASVLIESTSNNLAEMDATPNKNSLEGFDAIKKVKSEIEKICPGVVSCADIVALASRDSLLITRGLYFPVPLGRRDGVISIAEEAEANLPSPFMNFTELVQNFEATGLTPKDMVVLSGAHTIGETHCTVIWPRLYNFSSTVKTDPSLNPKFAAQLRRKCPEDQPVNDEDILLDPTKGGQVFDSLYYKNVLANKTTFVSDSALITDPFGRSLVESFAANPSTPFLKEFGVSMVKMGQIGVLTGKKGVIRKDCSRV